MVWQVDIFKSVDEDAQRLVLLVSVAGDKVCEQTGINVISLFLKYT